MSFLINIVYWIVVIDIAILIGAAWSSLWNEFTRQRSKW